MATILFGQKRFECNGETLISTSNGSTTNIFRPLYIPFSPPSFGILATYTGDFDALGFNPKDNYVYSVEQHTNTIVRHSLYTTFERIGTASIVDTLKSNAGDCTADGLYVCYDYALHQMLVFDVVANFSLLRQINLFWDPSSANQGAFTSRIFDFAFDPNNPKAAYSYQGVDIAPSPTQGALLKINLDFDDPNLGMVTPIEKIDAKDVQHIAALTFDRNSTLFGFGSSKSGLNPPQNNFFTINTYQGQLTPILTYGQGQILSDGCSCAFSLTFTNAVPFRNGMFCSNDTKTFVLAFDNNSYIPLTNVILKDTLPEGTIIKSISTNTFKGKIDAGTGIGTNILSISELEIPAKEKFEIQLEVMTIDAKDGPAYNQAFLHNLPPRFPAIVGSDDPNSSTAGDRSNFFFTTRRLENLSWKTTPPTDCIQANDGKIIVATPELIPGQSFEVSLRNTIDWSECIKRVVVDNKNSFTVDSLYPGKYQLFRLRSINDNCSLSLKDTTILLEAPNQLLSLQLNSNSPVCAGKAIVFNNTMLPLGQILWRGPNIFGSGDINPRIEDADTSMAGRYDAVATYGFCTKEKSIEVAVKQQITSSIEGQLVYCVRDTLGLEVIPNDTSKNLLYTWFGPDSLKSTQSILRLPNIGQNQTGYYEVISTNGACYDTVGVEIIVQPTPTLSLDESILTDYCEPLLLFPKVTGDNNVSYQWFPQDGLSCTDCLNPQVLPIVQSNYQLKVENAYHCGDSATVKIILDKGKVVYAPNVFTPTASIENSQFTIFPRCAVYYIHSIDIYDRYGGLVFKTKALSPSDALESWDGYVLGKAVVSGVYVWHAKVELVDGSILYLEGDVAKW